MKPISFGPDGADPLRRAYRRSPLRNLLRVRWTHRGLRPTDVMLASYPRSGNLWLRFMLVELLRGDVSFERVISSAPYVGSHHAAPPFLPRGSRLIKTHEPYLASYRRAIHVVRDPRDVVLSYFKFLLRNGKLVIPEAMAEGEAFDRFIDAFISGRLDPHGTWNGHLVSWIAAAGAGRADVMRIRFEDFRVDPFGNLARVCRWLGADATSKEIQRAVERSALDRMREATRSQIPPGVRPSPDLPPLVNQGNVGGWRDVLDERQVQKFEAFAEGLRLMRYPIS